LAAFAFLEAFKSSFKNLPLKKNKFYLTSLLLPNFVCLNVHSIGDSFRIGVFCLVLVISVLVEVVVVVTRIVVDILLANDDVNIDDVVDVITVVSNLFVDATDGFVVLVVIVFDMVDAVEVVLKSVLVLSSELIFGVVDIRVVDVVILVDVVVDSVKGIVTRRRF